MIPKKKPNVMSKINHNETVYDCGCEVSADEFTHIGPMKNGGEHIARRSVGYFQGAVEYLMRDKLALILILILLFIVLGSVFIPMLSSYSFREQHLEHVNAGMFYTAPDGHHHLFGTDSLGRDLFVRIWEGGRISLSIAFAAVLINCLIGILYGGISGYFGGRLDNILMRVIDIINGIPYLLIIILLMTIMKRGIATIIIAYAAVGWCGMARLVRGQILQLKEQEFVICAQTMGASAFRILLKHMIPNILSLIIVNLTLAIPGAIFTEAYLSFIGLGVPIPMASWGTLANDGIVNFQRYAFQLLLPAFFISITMLSFNLLGDKLRDAFDPKLRR